METLDAAGKVRKRGKSKGKEKGKRRKENEKSIQYAEYAE